MSKRWYARFKLKAFQQELSFSCGFSSQNDTPVEVNFDTSVKSKKSNNNKRIGNHSKSIGKHNKRDKILFGITIIVSCFVWRFLAHLTAELTSHPLEQIMFGQPGF